MKLIIIVAASFVGMVAASANAKQTQTTEFGRAVEVEEEDQPDEERHSILHSLLRLRKQLQTQMWKKKHILRQQSELSNNHRCGRIID
jgi:hypothetical protein